MKEELIYKITERLPGGESTLILYAYPSRDGGVWYCFEHFNQQQHCESFTEAIALAKEEWEREKYNLMTPDPSYLPTEDAPDIF